jgi:hypothetical protein
VRSERQSRKEKREPEKREPGIQPKMPLNPEALFCLSFSLFSFLFSNSDSHFSLLFPHYYLLSPHSSLPVPVL